MNYNISFEKKKTKKKSGKQAANAYKCGAFQEAALQKLSWASVPSCQQQSYSFGKSNGCKQTPNSFCL